MAVWICTMILKPYFHYDYGEDLWMNSFYQRIVMWIASIHEPNYLNYFLKMYQIIRLKSSRN